MGLRNIMGTDPSGTSNIAAEVKEIETHLHSVEHWFGAAAVPSAETHVADEMSGTILPFQCTTGNNDFGAWVQVLGSDDTPFMSASMTHFDPHRFSISAASSANQYVAQVVQGESADIAAKLLLKRYTIVPYKSILANVNFAIQDVQSSRILARQKVWVRIACVGANAQTLDFYFGIHEYSD